MAKTAANKSAAKKSANSEACAKLCERAGKVHPIFASIVFIVIIAGGFGILGAVVAEQHREIKDLKSQITNLRSEVKEDNKDLDQGE